METMEKESKKTTQKTARTERVSLWHMRRFVRHGQMSVIASGCGVHVATVTAVMKGVFSNQCVFDALLKEIEEGKRQAEENSKKLKEIEK